MPKNELKGILKQNTDGKSKKNVTFSNSERGTIILPDPEHLPEAQEVRRSNAPLVKVGEGYTANTPTVERYDPNDPKHWLEAVDTKAHYTKSLEVVDSIKKVNKTPPKDLSSLVKITTSELKRLGSQILGTTPTAKEAPAEGPTQLRNPKSRGGR